MPKPAWFPRILALLFAAGGLFYSAGMLLGFLIAPQSGIDADVDNLVLHVSKVEAGSPAARAGIQPRHHYRIATTGDALAYAFPHAGTQVHLTAPDGRALTLTFEERQIPLGENLRFVAQALLAALALLMGLRAWGDPQARRLTVLFAGFSNYATADALPVNWELLYLIPAWYAVSPWAAVAFARFGTGYPSMPQPAGRILRVIAIVLGVAYFLALIASIVPSLSSLPAGCWAAVALVGLLGLLLSFVRSRGDERQRIAWVLVSFAAGLGPIAAYELYVFASGAPETWTWQAIPFLAMPLGMAYATLRLRVIDIGFALSRAGVFSVMTLLIAGVFGVLESLADKMLAEASHTESMVIELVITLVIVYVIRYFHHHIEHAIERVIFAARNRRIALISSIADAFGVAGHPEEVSAVLVERLRNDASIPAAVYVEEDGVLRHDAGDARLHPESASSVRSFPLETFKRTRGTLVCELPGEDEFAPDEASALQRLAREAAIARETARVDALTAEVRDLRERLNGPSAPPSEA